MARLLDFVVPCPSGLSVWIGTRRWTVLPPLLWFLIASPLLGWSFGFPLREYFRWPLPDPVYPPDGPVEP